MSISPLLKTSSVASYHSNLLIGPPLQSSPCRFFPITSTSMSSLLELHAVAVSNYIPCFYSPLLIPGPLPTVSFPSHLQLTWTLLFSFQTLLACHRYEGKTSMHHHISLLRKLIIPFNSLNQYCSLYIFCHLLCIYLCLFSILLIYKLLKGRDLVLLVLIVSVITCIM